MLTTALTLACGNGGAPSSDPSPTPRSLQDIRLINFEQAPVLQNTLRQLGSGEVAVREILYADLTGDGVEEAVVPVSSGGSLGNIAYVVVTLKKDNAPAIILTRRLEQGSAGGLRMSLDTSTGSNVLVETAAAYGDEDPFCCPSVLRRTTFRWDGSQLQVEREVKTQATPGPKHRGD